MTPDFQILADSIDKTAQFKDRLIGLTLNDQAGQKSDSAQLTIDNRENRVELPKDGAVLEVSLGFVETGLSAMGRYVVDEISGDLFPATLRIGAKAGDMRGPLKAPKTRAWEGVTLHDIVGKIASEHGLKLAISDSLKSHAYGYLAQTAESDLNFLTRLARDLDATAKPAGGSLVFMKRGEAKTADGRALPVPVIALDQMRSGSWKITGRATFGRAVAQWSELGKATVHNVQTGDTDPVLSLRHRYASKAEAIRAADSALARSKRASATISIRLAGFHPDLLAEGKVDLQGIHPDLTGEWLVTRVTHRLSATLTTSFEAERNNSTESL